MELRRVLYTTGFADVRGGGQKSLLLILKSLNIEKFKPILMLPDYGIMAERDTQANIETVILRTPTLRSMDFIECLKSFLKLRKFIKDKNIELIHTDAPRQTLYLGILSKILRIPLIWHVRTAEAENKYYEKILYWLSDKIIAVSNAAAGRFKDFKRFRDKVKVIYNAIDLKEFDKALNINEIKRDVGIDDSDIIIGCVSRITPEKGFEDFLDAAKLIAERFPQARFLIAGVAKEEYEETLKDKAMNLGLSQKIFFLGFKENIPEVMSVIDIFVFPSRQQEGLPRVILEAMAASKVVVATSVGGNGEIVVKGLTGMLVAPKNPINLSEAISQLIVDREKRIAMGKAGRSHVEQFFDNKKFFSQLEGIYHELLR
jgi:glycosyltransferase involved in cell wall biosynthesis